MKREEAINNFAKIKLEQLTPEERAEQLEVMRLENWEDDSEWRKLPIKIKKEFNSQKLSESPDSKRYDEVLMIWIRDELKAVTNEYLVKELRCEYIEGKPVRFEACPCCGRRTIRIRNHFNICRVCWW